MSKMDGDDTRLQAETRSWMKEFAWTTAFAAFIVIFCFALLLWITGTKDNPDKIRVGDWQNVAAGLALLAIPVAFAGSYVVIKIAQLATNLADKQRQQMDRQTRLLESQVRLQAHQLLQDDLATAGERAEAVIAWRLAWRRTLNRFWAGLEEATMPQPSAPPQATAPQATHFTAVQDDDIVPAGSAYSSEFEVTPEEQVKEQVKKREAARARALVTVSDSLRELHRLAHQADAMGGLDACVRDQLKNTTSSFAILSFLRPHTITSADEDLYYEKFTPSHIRDLLPNMEKVEQILNKWWTKNVEEEDIFNDIDPRSISLYCTMKKKYCQDYEKDWEDSVNDNYRSLCRLFGYRGALFVSLLPAVADSPEAYVIADTPHAAENADRVAQHVRLAFARAGIDDPLRPEIEDWIRSIVAYARRDPRRLTTIPEEEWPIADQVGWDRILSADACRIISEINSGRRPNRNVEDSET
jgi:muconolactone delta-isomerase